VRGLTLANILQTNLRNTSHDSKIVKDIPVTPPTTGAAVTCIAAQTKTARAAKVYFMVLKRD
jgi:hypothetical protein